LYGHVVLHELAAAKVLHVVFTADTTNLYASILCPF